MMKLKAASMDEAFLNFISSGRPFLGICLGMQLLFEKGLEFGEHEGLGVIKGKIVKFEEDRFSSPLKVPHVGWNVCDFTRETPINKGLPRETYLYFVHSFHAVCEPEFVLARTHYGYDFVSAVAKGNVYGFQPHPEKSHENGLKILKNFTEL
jgi:glutamine amidotransferase